MRFVEPNDFASGRSVNSSSRPRDLITVCVCTYRRQALLRDLLERLESQSTEGQFDYEVVVVENDVERHSEATVLSAVRTGGPSIRYDCEPERNISLARNRAVEMASGSLVAMIDDDETPVGDWLLHHYRTLNASGAQGVLGPVISSMPADGPGWLAVSGVLDRPRRPTGEPIGPQDMRTGNALLRRTLFTEGNLWFDPALGRSGGEDTDFFSRGVAAGHTFVWCDEAIVSESVPPERWTARFHLRRMWRSGTIRGRWIHDGRQSWTLAVRGMMYLVAGIVALPFSLVVPTAWRMRLALKVAYFGGVVTAALGWATLRHRE